MLKPTQILSVLLLLLLTSCGWNTYYHEQITLEDSRWYKASAARFNVSVQDTINPFDFYINIRNTTTYRYSNLYLFISTRFPNGNVSRDTVEFILADESGKWYGKGWGKLKDNSVRVNESLQFPIKGNYEFLIQQAMREDTLKGISDIGIKIVRSE